MYSVILTIHIILAVLLTILVLLATFRRRRVGRIGRRQRIQFVHGASGGQFFVPGNGVFVCGLYLHQFIFGGFGQKYDRCGKGVYLAAGIRDARSRTINLRRF